MYHDDVATLTSARACSVRAFSFELHLSDAVELQEALAEEAILLVQVAVLVVALSRVAGLTAALVAAARNAALAARALPGSSSILGATHFLDSLTSLARSTLLLDSFSRLPFRTYSLIDSE